MALPIEQQGLYQDGNSIFENVFIQGTLNVATANEKLVVRSDGITIDSITTNSDGKTIFSGDVQIDGDELFISDSIKHVGDTDTLISFPSNDTINFRTNGTERLRITSGGDVTIGGNIGIGTDNPDVPLDVRGGGTLPAQFITTTSGSNGATIRIRKSDANLAVNDKIGAIQFAGDDGTDDYISEFAKIEATVDDATFSSEDGTLKFYTGTNGSSTEKLSILSGGQVNIGGDYSQTTHTLKVTGSIKKTVYEPGEIIEQLETQADGNAVTVQSGTYTPANVTAVQNLSTTHTTINGSSFDYTPPVGTTRLIYEFWVFMRDTDVGPLLHFQGRVDGTVVSNSRHTWRAATANADYQMWIYSKMILRVGVTENLSAGDVGTWTSAKTIDFTAREYSSTYEGRFHRTNHWDGTTGDITVKPRIRITAIA